MSSSLTSKSISAEGGIKCNADVKIRINHRKAIAFTLGIGVLGGVVRGLLNISAAIIGGVVGAIVGGACGAELFRTVELISNETPPNTV